MTTSTKNYEFNFLRTIKTFLVLTVLILSSQASFSQTDATKTVTVTIENINNTRGQMMIGLHNSDTFMKANAVQSIARKIKGNTLTVTFEDVAPGAYSIMVLHDENSNQKMDFSGDGMPIESYGISNNPTLMGPPTFSDGEFEVKENVSINIEF